MHDKQGVNKTMKKPVVLAIIYIGLAGIGTYLNLDTGDPFLLCLVRGLVIAAVIIAIAALYWLPTIVAKTRNHPKTLAIGVLNTFSGATVIGWVGSLVWACSHTQSQT
jgi:Superinfection immunity protein